MLQLLVLVGELLVSMFLIILNISDLNNRFLSFGVFLLTFSGLQLVALRLEAQHKQLAMQIRWLTMAVLVVFVILTFLRYV